MAVRYSPFAGLRRKEAITHEKTLDRHCAADRAADGDRRRYREVGVRQESDGSAYALYFVERDLRSADGGDALRSEERTLEDSGLSAEELAAALVAELLKGPADPTLKSPFPKGTALLSAEQKGTELRVDLSAAYSTLSGVGLSLADYAITLTLTQLPDVARVRITVAGRELDYRSRQVFLARDILTVPKEDVVGTVDASLYFVNGDGALTAEARTLNLYEGDTQVSAWCGHWKTVRRPRAFPLCCRRGSRSGRCGWKRRSAM